MTVSERTGRALTVLNISPWPGLFSMGSGQGAQDLHWEIEGLLERRHRVLHLLPGDDSATSTPGRGLTLVPFKFREGPVLSAIPPRLRPLGSWAALNLRVLARARSLRRAYDFDVVIACAPYVAPAAWWLGRRSQVPVVVNVFGSFLAPILHRRERFLIPEYWGWKFPADQWIILNDGTMADRVALARAVPAERFVFWRNGVDKAATSSPVDTADVRKRFEVAADEDLVVVACRLVNWKRVDRLIRAAPRVLASRPRCSFVVAGDGPERWALMALARDLGVDASFRFPGALDNSHVLDLMKASDVVLSLNDLSNVGNPLLEAMACGKAIVAVDVGGTDEVISDRDTGLLVAPDDDEALAAAIVEILDDVSLRETLGAGARRFADAEIPSWSERAARQAELVERVAGAAPARPGARQEGRRA